MKPLYRRHVLVAGAALILGLLWWWPLPLNVTTHVPGSETWAFDEYTFVWNLWWFKSALLRFATNPLHSDWLFHPLGIDLVLYTYNVANAALTFPLVDLIGLVPATNLVLLFTTVLSAWGMWLLVRWLLHTEGFTGLSVEAAALVAGAVYAFGAYRSIYAALGHYDMVSTGFLPLFALFWLKSLWRPGRKAPVLGGVFLAGALYNEMIFGVFLAMLAVVLWLFSLRRLDAGWWWRVLLLSAVASVLWAPVGIPVVLTFLSADFALTGWGDALKLSADLFSFTTPVALHPIFGTDWVRELRLVQEGNARFRDVNTVFVGTGVLVLALLALATLRRRVAGWFTGLVAFMVFSLGPLLQINGQIRYNFDGIETGIPMPFILLHYLPIVKGNRAANRFSVVLMLCAAVLVGYAVWWLVSRFTIFPQGRLRRDLRFTRRDVNRQSKIDSRKSHYPRRSTRSIVIVTVLIAGILLFEQLAIPLPLTDARVPAAYGSVTSDPEDVAVLTLPLGWRNSFGVLGAENTRLEYYQTMHGKRLVGGNISRAPAFKFDYFERLPVIRSLIEIQTDTRAEISTEQRAADKAQADELVRLLGARYLVVHPPIEGRPPYADNYEAAFAYASEMWNLELVEESEGARVYRINTAPAPETLIIDMGDSTSVMYRGENWAGNEAIAGASANWALTRESQFLLPPVETDTEFVRLTLRMQPFLFPDAGPQTFELWVNGEPLRSADPPSEMAEGWQEYAFSIPSDTLHSSMTNELAIRWARADEPRAVVPATRQIGTTGVPFDGVIEVTAGSAEHGDIAFITVDGEDASDHRRGVNVTVLHEDTGEVMNVRGFDTAANEFEAQALADFVSSIQPGRVVIVAFKGAAAANLTPAAREALSTLGASQIPDATTTSYAFIGVKGAIAGTAAQSATHEGTAYVQHRPDDRPLAAAVDWVRLETVE